MKKITLNGNGTFQHVWIEGLHTIPESAIDVSDAVMLELSQNPQSKAFVEGSVVDFSTPFNLANARTAKKGEVRAAFSVAASLPVSAAGFDWSGGFDSALKMDAAKRMAELAGLPSITLFDANNVEHVMTIAAAEAVILTVGADYQAKFATKQALMVAVDAATDEAELSSVVVSF